MGGLQLQCCAGFLGLPHHGNRKHTYVKETPMFVVVVPTSPVLSPSSSSYIYLLSHPAHPSAEGRHRPSPPVGPI
ncbi:hypothetical protein Cadr_000014519 [Camelus dromedarius]|uniref:Uncharacterized protein n=1 Tax=Camelus dromedarius TaxID=9838 RepID=A0A5N4DM88_CAMDR|nr:hypothetical protein Cadr_000014519 [Camelus dromedarius]